MIQLGIHTLAIIGAIFLALAVVIGVDLYLGAKQAGMFAVGAPAISARRRDALLQMRGAAIAVLVIGAGLTRYMSLGAIAGVVGVYVILIPLTIFARFPVEDLIYAFVGAIFIIIWHRDNISRLLAGTERRLGERVPVGDYVSSTHS